MRDARCAMRDVMRDAMIYIIIHYRNSNGHAHAENDIYVSTYISLLECLPVIPRALCSLLITLMYACSYTGLYLFSGSNCVHISTEILMDVY